MAPHHFLIHLNKLLFHVKNQITLISAKLSVTLYNQHTSCKKLWPVFWPCTMHKRASRHWRHSFMTSFFIVVHFTYKMAYLCLLVVSFGDFFPQNVVGHHADPKKALPCVIARNLSHCAWNYAQGTLQ